MIAASLRSLVVDPRTGSRSRGGYAMLLVLIAIAVATVVAMGVLQSLTPAATLASNTRNSSDALNVALSGLDAMEAYVLDDGIDWTTEGGAKSEGTWFSDVAMGSGTVTISAERTDGDPNDDAEGFQANDTVTFTAVGAFGGVTAIAQRTVVTQSPDAIRVLFVLNNQTAPTPGSDEETKRDLMRGWGFDVSYISSTEAQSVFDAAALVNDVAYITEDVIGSHVNTKLKGFTIGVVSEEAALNDDFGFSSTAYAYNTTTIDITDNLHYITDHLSLGNHTIADSSQQMVYAYGTYAGGIRTLAERPSTSYPQLFVLDAGDALYGGGNAAGRRVMLPWGNSGSSFTFQGINANGHEIMKKAIEWAALPGTPSGGSDEPHIQVAGEIEIKSGSDVDSYDSGSGAYSSGSSGANAVMASNTTSSDKIKIEGDVEGDVYCGVGGTPSSVIDLAGGSISGTTDALSSALDTSRPSAPSGFPGSSGDRTISSNTTIGTAGSGTQFTYGKLEIKEEETLTIRGDVEIKITDEMKLEEEARVVLDSGATLKLYINKKLDVSEEARINSDSSRTADLEVYLYGSDGEVVLGEESRFAGFLHVADKLELKEDSRFYGRMIVGDKLVVDDADIHADEGLTPP